MQRQGLAALEAQLGAAPPPSLAQLSDDDLAHLSRTVHEARRRQSAELAAAGEQAFSYVPRLLRIPIRKILG